MIDRTLKLTPNFRLSELVPKDCEDVPPWILGELTDLCTELLEPVRFKFGPLVIHDAYRTPEANAAASGVVSSDHLDGRAADFHVTGNIDRNWQEQTTEAFHWIREHLLGRFGQVILEDHRKSLNDQGKLWIHIAMPSSKHPGTSGDVNSILVSLVPNQYMALAHTTVTGNG
jgi:hypothetical protein